MKLKNLLKSISAFAVIAATSVYGVQINEIRTDEPGGDDSNEYIELSGTDGESLDGVWYIVLGDHSNFNNPDQNPPNYASGVVEFAIDLSGFTIPSDGYFLIATADMQIDVLGLEVTDIDYLVSNINFENSDNTTHMLVEGYTGLEVLELADQYSDLAVDIDDDDDGTPNATLPWTSVIDAVGLVETPNDSDPEEYVYGETFGGVDIGPDGSFTPGQVFRGANNNAWNIGEFNLIDDAGTGVDPEAVDTPGTMNADSIVTPIISGFSPATVRVGEVVTITGTNFTGTTSVTLAGVETSFNVVDDGTIEVTIADADISGTLVVTTPEGSVASASDLTVDKLDLDIIFTEDFETDLGNFTTVSVASDEDWAHGTFGGNGFAEISGFGANEASDDYLISPSIDLSGTSAPVLVFETARNFDGPVLQVLISTSYDGTSVPNPANWDALSGDLSEGGYNIVSSGAIDLSAYAGETVHVAFRYTSDGPDGGQSAAEQVHSFTVGEIAVDSGVIYSEDFEADLGMFTTYSAASNEDWAHGTFGGNGFAEISGFGADVASDDYLVSPAIDLAGTIAPVLNFSTARNFDGPVLQVLISASYDGTSAPDPANWTALSATLSESGYEIVESGDVDLSAYVGETVYIAFRYTSTGTGGGEGAVEQVHDFSVIETVTADDYIVSEDFEADLGDFTTVSISSNEDWAHGTFGGNGFAEVSGFGADAASDDYLISPVIDLTNAGTPTLIFQTARNFDGPELQVLISSSYDGLVPDPADWDAITATLSDTGYEIVSSGAIDLSAYAGETVHVAFRYTSTGTGGGEGAVYQVHDFLVYDAGPAAFTPGWVFDENISWTYMLSADWGYNTTFGYVYTARYPWVYQINFGWVYHALGTVPTGAWVYVPTVGYIYVLESNEGWFQFPNGDWDNFITPQD